MRDVREVDERAWIVGTQLDGPLQRLDGLGGPPFEDERLGECAPGVRLVRSELGGPLEIGEGAGLVELQPGPAREPQQPCVVRTVRESLFRQLERAAELPALEPGARLLEQLLPHGARHQAESASQM